jgi:hypothetical protein
MERALQALGRDGNGTLTTGEYPMERGRLRESLADALLAAAGDDNFRPCTVAFGEPARSFLRTSDGHPVLWVGLATGEPSVTAVTGDLEVRVMDLDWGKLV